MVIGQREQEEGPREPSISLGFGWTCLMAPESHDRALNRSTRDRRFPLSLASCAHHHGGPLLQRRPVIFSHDYTVLTIQQVSGGFLEGIVRGYKAGILTQAQYASLCQCETLEGTSIHHFI